MIIVSVQLVSAIHPSRSRELARMEICNVGGDTDIGDYEVKTLRGRCKEQLDRRSVTRHGKITGYPRLAIHVWHLVSEALKAVQYDRRSKL
jgi:hypothetical protein